MQCLVCKFLVNLAVTHSRYSFMMRGVKGTRSQNIFMGFETVLHVQWYQSSFTASVNGFHCLHRLPKKVFKLFNLVFVTIVLFYILFLFLWKFLHLVHCLFL